jgi:hypothetical protein
MCSLLPFLLTFDMYVAAAVFKKTDTNMQIVIKLQAAVGTRVLAIPKE